MVFLWRHGLSQLVALCQHVAAFANTSRELELGPLLASTWTLQDINVEVGKLGIVEIEVRSTVGVIVEQVGTSPVQHGHEVIADAVDALGREVAQRLLIHLDLVVAVRATILDGLYDWQRLDDAPAHAVALDILTQVANFFTGPYLTQRYIMQGRHDALYSDLS